MRFNYTKCIHVVITFYLFLCLNTTASALSPLEELNNLASSSILFIDKDKSVLQTKNPNQLLIPASTIKLLTSLIALEHWGEDYRFKTEFYFDESSNSLWVKGYGDPFLISEELDLVVEVLKNHGYSEFDAIGIDNSYFSKTINIDGQGQSLNPYDAAVGATAANFNTINVRVYADSISSSETQTPLTPLANELAQGLSIGSHRINLGNSEHGPQYFLELLKAKLNQASIPTVGIYLRGQIPSESKLIFTHLNSKRLEQVITAMLEYSNNFVANQLYLALGAERFGAPASLKKSQNMFNEYIQTNFNWSNHVIEEGAGLSRKNRLSAKQLIDVLEKLEPYKHLLPNQSPEIFAKSGTLSNVSTYAGYINRDDHWSPFAIMINQRVNFHFREEVAKELLKH